MSLGAAGIGAIWAVVNSAYNKKEEKESEESRVSKYLEYMVRVEEKLKNKLGTKVKINQKNNGKGKIEIEYYSADDFDRIIEAITQK